MLPPPARLRACALVLPTPPQGGSDARESRFSSPRLHNGWCAMTADCMEQRFPLPSHNPIIEVLPERCRSGRTDPTGNRVYGYRRTVGSNPTLSAKPHRKDMPCARRHAEITSRHEGFPTPILELCSAPSVTQRRSIRHCPRTVGNAQAPCPPNASSTAPMTRLISAKRQRSDNNSLAD